MVETIEAKQNEWAGNREWAEPKRFSKYVRELTADMPELEMTEEKLAFCDRAADARHRALDQKMRREHLDFIKERTDAIFGE